MNWKIHYLTKSQRGERVQTPRLLATSLVVTLEEKKMYPWPTCSLQFSRHTKLPYFQLVCRIQSSNLNQPSFGTYRYSEVVQFRQLLRYIFAILEYGSLTRGRVPIRKCSYNFNVKKILPKTRKPTIAPTPGSQIFAIPDYESSQLQVPNFPKR